MRIRLLLVAAAVVGLGAWFAGSSNAGRAPSGAASTPSPASAAASPAPSAASGTLPPISLPPPASGSQTPPYSNPYFQGAYEYAIATAEQKTGLTYVASGCASNPPCLSNALETDGENATYVGMDATGYSGGTRCYVYVYRDPINGWQTFAALCGSKPDFSPVYGDTVPVRVSGGCAHIRQGPSLNDAIVACVPNGTLVKIDATPTYGDAKMWWGVASASAAGWMSQEFLQD